LAKSFQEADQIVFQQEGKPDHYIKGTPDAK
jgi:hypothetical protein